MTQPVRQRGSGDGAHADDDIVDAEVVDEGSDSGDASDAGEGAKA